jgi:hypothetical protein
MTKPCPNEIIMMLTDAKTKQHNVLVWFGKINSESDDDSEYNILYDDCQKYFIFQRSTLTANLVSGTTLQTSFQCPNM